MSSCIIFGYSQVRHQVGTVSEDWTLTPVDTDINVNGTGITITLPVTPSDNQQITVTNTGGSSVGVGAGGVGVGSGSSTSVAPGSGGGGGGGGGASSKIFYWGGASWGWANTDCTDGELPQTSDRGTSQYAGPSETPYSVPQTTAEISNVLELPCGTTVIKTVTKTYSSRSFANGYKITGSNYTILTGNASAGVGLGNTLILAGSYGFNNNPQLPLGGGWQLISSSIIPYNPANGNISPSVVGADCLYGTRRRISDGITVTDNITVFMYFTTTRPTLYYLDVHEVWTYSAI